MLSRRNFLIYSSIAAASASIAAGLHVYQWWDTPAEAPYIHLNKREAQIIQCLAKAAFPSGSTSDLDGEQAQLDRFFDRFLDQLQHQNRTLLKMLIQATDRITFPSHRSYFTDIPTQEQQKIIEGLLGSDQHLIRAAYLSLIAILGMGYSTHPQISEMLSELHRCGYG